MSCIAHSTKTYFKIKFIKYAIMYGIIYDTLHMLQSCIILATTNPGNLKYKENDIRNIFSLMNIF